MGADSNDPNYACEIFDQDQPTLPHVDSDGRREAYTIQFWFKTSQNSGQTVLFDYGGPLGSGTRWRSHNGITFYGSGASFTMANYWWGSDCGVAIPGGNDGNWHHITWTYDPSTYTRTGYYDFAEVKTCVDSSTEGVLIDNFCFGSGQMWRTDRYHGFQFVGEVKNFYIMNRKLSVTEVRDLDDNPPSTAGAAETGSSDGTAVAVATGSESGVTTVTAESYTYVVDCTSRNYVDSVAYCASQGMTIASFHSDEDVAMVGTPSCNAYLGGESTGAGYQWNWNDGSAWWQYSVNDGLDGISSTRLVWKNDGTGWHDWGHGGIGLGVICKSGSSTSGDGTAGAADTGNSNGASGAADTGSSDDTAVVLHSPHVKLPPRFRAGTDVEELKVDMTSFMTCLRGCTDGMATNMVQCISTCATTALNDLGSSQGRRLLMDSGEASAFLKSFTRTRKH